MTSYDTEHPASVLTAIRQASLGSRRFRKHDLIAIPLVGVALALVLIAGKGAVARLLHSDLPQVTAPAYLLGHLALGVGLSLVLAALQTRRDGVTVASTLAAWGAIVISVAVATWTAGFDRAGLANSAVVVAGSLGAAFWLYQKRR